MNKAKFRIMLASIALFAFSLASLVSAKGWVQVGADWFYQNADGDYLTETVQSSGDSKFYLGEDGAMVKDFFLESYGNGDNSYYFGADGKMVTNSWVAIDPSFVSDQGDYIPDAYYYYFQATGKAVKAGADSSIKKTTIDGKKYAFNTSGQMLTGWITADGNIVNPDENDYPYTDALYYAGNDNDGVLHSGWLTYYDAGEGNFKDRDFMYFYFNPTNNRKIGNSEDNQVVYHYSSHENGDIAYATKKINGKTYAFEIGTGIMLIEWEGYNGSTNSSIPTNSNAWYFSKVDDGHRVQKGWVHTVPAEDIDEQDYRDDEEQWFYFSNNGDMVRDQIKKINGQYYMFDKNGIMKTGLIIVANGQYGDAFDMDNTRGGELSKGGIYRNKNNQRIKLNSDALNNVLYNGEAAAIHYFVNDGTRKVGATDIEFADDKFTFVSNNAGNNEGTKSKKYYSFGIQLKASPDIRYGLIVASESNVRSAVNYETTNFYVLNTSGAKVKGANSAKKDADGNYWLIDKATGYLVGVWNVQVRNHSGEGFQFKGDRGNQNNTWINAGERDNSGKTAVIENKGKDGHYYVDLEKSMDYALNFYWEGNAEQYKAD